jgi:hypothetical protein
VSFLWFLALRSCGSPRRLKPVVFNLYSTEPRGVFGKFNIHRSVYRNIFL